MKATFNDFIQNAPNYKKFAGDPVAIYVFEKILSRDENIIGMIDISEAGKPAICACLKEVEDYCESQSSLSFDLKDNFTKQALGTMVKIILEPFGYLSKTQKDIPKSYQARYVSSAMTYEKVGPASMKVVRRVEPI